MSDNSLRRIWWANAKWKNGLNPDETQQKANTTLNFGIQNVFDTDYTTVWGSRAKALYGGTVGQSVANEIFDYKGRGRTFAVSLTKVF